ncbi:hypothetical protein ACOMHN_029994 [Nucella lapillus]
MEIPDNSLKHGTPTTHRLSRLTQRTLYSLFVPLISVCRDSLSGSPSRPPAGIATSNIAQLSTAPKKPSFISPSPASIGLFL